MDKIAVYSLATTKRKPSVRWWRVFGGYCRRATSSMYMTTTQLTRPPGSVVCREYQQGKGNVIRRMFREIDAECYIMADGDDIYSAEYTHEMIRQVLGKKVDMVVGDRLSSTYFDENRRPFYNLGNSLVRKSISLFFESNIQDVMTGYRAF